MVILEVSLLNGRAPDQIEQLMSALTGAVSRTLGIDAAHITVVIREVQPTHWSVGGRSLARLTAERG